MLGKRKFAQISNEDQKSDDLSSTSEKNAFKKRSKRMKIRESSNDQKVIYEKSRQKSISIAKSKIQKSNRKVFSQNELTNEEEVIDTWLKYNKEATNKKHKSSEEILDGMIIHEMLSESECSDDESIQASIITSLTDKFDIIEEESDGNCLFRALSRGCFGSPDYHFDIRESIWDYILHNRKRFADHLPQDIDEYIQKMLEDGEWGGEPEIVAFSELYNVNVTVYDAMTSSIPYLIAENQRATHTVYVLMINNDHFNTLTAKNSNKFAKFDKIKKKDYKKKIESVIRKPEKDNSFMGEYSTVYSKNTYSAIKKYLESNTYPEEITSLEWKKKNQEIQKKEL